MRIKALQFLLLLLGLAAVGIGLSIIGFGPDKTVHFFVRIIEIIGVQRTPITNFNAVNVDNEFRFYAVFWVAYGGFLIQTSRDLVKHGQRIPLLLALFFIGGIARVISFIAVGTPHTLFNILMGIELVLPVFLYWLWRGSKQT